MGFVFLLAKGVGISKLFLSLFTLYLNIPNNYALHIGLTDLIKYHLLLHPLNPSLLDSFYYVMQWADFSDFQFFFPYFKIMGLFFANSLLQSSSKKYIHKGNKKEQR